MRAETKECFNLPGRSHELVDIEVSEGSILIYKARQIRFRVRSNTVSRANDVGNTFRL